MPLCLPLSDARDAVQFYALIAFFFFFCSPAHFSVMMIFFSSRYAHAAVRDILISHHRAHRHVEQRRRFTAMPR